MSEDGERWDIGQRQAGGSGRERESREEWGFVAGRDC